MDYKKLSNSIKDVDTKNRIVTGYLASFGDVDYDNDVIVKGSFLNSIAKKGPDGNKDIKYLLDHNLRQVVGVFNKLYEDEKGLGYESKIARHTLGQDYALMVEDGVITQHSIGFEVLKAFDDRTSGIRTITEIDLWEGSGLQAWGANRNTPITGIKALPQTIEEIVQEFDILEKALKSGKYSDETFKTIIIPRLDQIKALMPAPEPSQEEIELVEYLQNLKFNASK